MAEDAVEVVAGDMQGNQTDEEVCVENDREESRETFAAVEGEDGRWREARAVDFHLDTCSARLSYVFVFICLGCLESGKKFPFFTGSSTPSLASRHSNLSSCFSFLCKSR